MSITVSFNGESCFFDQTIYVADLLQKLKIPAGSVVVARNTEILPRDRFWDVSVEDGEQLEIIRFVWGG